MTIQVAKLLASLTLAAGVSYSCAAPRQSTATPAVHQTAAPAAVATQAHHG